MPYEFIDVDEDQGEWFQFFTSTIDPDSGEIIYDTPRNDAKVRLRSMAPLIEERLNKRTRKSEFIFNPKSRQMERVVYYEEPTTEELQKEREDTWDYVITGIEGFVDKKTKKLMKCDKKTKLKLMKNPVFDRFVARCMQLLANAGFQEKEEQEKNLSNG